MMAGKHDGGLIPVVLSLFVAQQTRMLPEKFPAPSWQNAHGMPDGRRVARLGRLPSNFFQVLRAGLPPCCCAPAVMLHLPAPAALFFRRSHLFSGALRCLWGGAAVVDLMRDE